MIKKFKESKEGRMQPSLLEESPYDSFCVMRKKLSEPGELGTVELAHQVETKASIVIKTSYLPLSKRFQEDPRSEVQFLRELKGCDCVPQLLGEWERKAAGMWKYQDSNGKIKTRFYASTHRFAMSYGGQDLLAFIQQRGYVTEKDALVIFSQIVQAVKVLHTKRIVHLDLKCENILIQDGKITICDFGRARELKVPGQLMEGITGTLYTMAPEILSSRKYNGELADMYSLGIILFTLLLGCPPYTHPSKNSKAFRLIYSAGRIDSVISAYIEGTAILRPSPACVELLSGLICPPYRRLSVDMTLQHRWLWGS